MKTTEYVTFLHIHLLIESYFHIVAAIAITISLSSEIIAKCQIFSNMICYPQYELYFFEFM